MSQAELASATGIAQTTLSHWGRACKLQPDEDHLGADESMLKARPRR